MLVVIRVNSLLLFLEHLCNAFFHVWFKGDLEYWEIWGAEANVTQVAPLSQIARKTRGLP